MHCDPRGPKNSSPHPNYPSQHVLVRVPNDRSADNGQPTLNREPCEPFTRFPISHGRDCHCRTSRRPAV
eukprot:2088695-Prymnesium_polylepis.1